MGFPQAMIYSIPKKSGFQFNDKSQPQNKVYSSTPDTKTTSHTSTQSFNHRDPSHNDFGIAHRHPLLFEITQRPHALVIFVFLDPNELGLLFPVDLTSQSHFF